MMYFVNLVVSHSNLVYVSVQLVKWAQFIMCKFEISVLLFWVVSLQYI